MGPASTKSQVQHSGSVLLRDQIKQEILFMGSSYSWSHWQHCHTCKDLSQLSNDVTKEVTKELTI